MISVGAFPRTKKVAVPKLQLARTSHSVNRLVSLRSSTSFLRFAGGRGRDSEISARYVLLLNIAEIPGS